MQTVNLQGDPNRTVKLGRKMLPEFLVNQLETASHIYHFFRDGRIKIISKLAAHFRAPLMTAGATGVPESVDYVTKAKAALTTMQGNDTEGDCVIADRAHSVGVHSSNDTDSTPIIATTRESLAAYHSICGPGDNGCVITDVLDYMRDHGIVFGGKLCKIDNYVAVDWTNKELVKAVIDIFGGIVLGINLPDAWTCTDCTWDVTNTRIVGGHDVPGISYGLKPPVIISATKDGVQISTWAGIVTITWEAFLSKKWIEEAYAVLAPQWYNSDRLAPNGFDVAALRAALDAVGNGTIPPIVPPQPPPPPPPPPGPGPIPIPPAPVPQTFTVHVPQQSVVGNFWTGYHLPAFDVQGVIGQAPAPSALPPWLLELLKAACAGSVALPPPWNVLAMLACGFIPKGDKLVQASAFTIPPWLIPVLRQLCTQADKLPQPWGTLVMLACAFLPPTAKSPCGCQEK